ncbi:hypothetical protein KKI90_01575 [Xenorhabdus bovienii]|uniref:hypothetical protein n=1 Tax=Xenorhabdus bovienii TaxID=40576 RepID=UPI00237C974F|nr:hypothetical protein [Xenorhabdus bovienii]MDE1485143.1 hypothetical protein [Xenorhabdus bovienii]MDE9476006.1 hypothetical protein [Xenorhabdus bovienii]MDE9528775.1 hypothetical protein [Xenorhabdus bovienii]
MKERSIIFNIEMIHAIFNGRKTQTRRVIQSPAKNMQQHGSEVIRYRAPGDKWYGDYVFSMRNECGTWNDYTYGQFIKECPHGKVGERLWVRETFSDISLDTVKEEYLRWKPLTYMPPSAPRITLEITDIRVERLYDISESDALAEGFLGCRDAIKNYGDNTSSWAHFNYWWIKNYGEGLWKSNPWVWVIEFRRV